jgi:hypothetical protein
MGGTALATRRGRGIACRPSLGVPNLLPKVGKYICSSAPWTVLPFKPR